jgi:hypothetical protein
MGKWQYFKSLWECVVSNIVITKELLIDTMNACEPALDFIENENLWDAEEPIVVSKFLEANRRVDLRWYINQKKTEAFVRFNGKEFTMGAYQVFNSLTGLHTRYETEAEATAALIETAKAVLAQHLPTVCQELSNENGDTCWIPTDFSTKYDIVKV